MSFSGIWIFLGLFNIKASLSESDISGSKWQYLLKDTEEDSGHWKNVYFFFINLALILWDLIPGGKKNKTTQKSERKNKIRILKKSQNFEKKSSDFEKSEF